MYQSLRSNVKNHILNEARKTCELARKNAFDMYSNNMRKQTFETFETLDGSHNQYYHAAIEFYHNNKVRGSEAIQEQFESELKNVMFRTVFLFPI